MQKQILQPPIYQEMKEYFHSLGLKEFPLFHAETSGWRIRAKLAIRGTAHSPEIGLFKKGTHEVESALDCPDHHPSINEAAQILKQEMISLKIVPYDETTLTGDLRYAQFTVERRTQKVQLVLVVNGKALTSPLQSLINSLSHKEIFHSIWVNFQSGSTNVIFGKEWKHCFGELDLWENLGGHEICFHPACFMQVHPTVFERMLASVQTLLTPQKKVVEFYAGVGVIGFSLVSKSKEIVCSEINPFSHECFEKTKAKLSTNFQQLISFETGSVSSLSALADLAEAIIVDPPRKGIDATLRKAIISSSLANELIYVSCGFDSFKRDVEDLLKSGWKIVKAEGFLLFPGTDHVEIIAKLQKTN